MAASGGLDAGFTLLTEPLANTRFADGAGTLTKEGMCAAATLASIVVCTLLYRSGRVVSPKLFRAYRYLSREDQRQWDIRYGSSLHAPLCVYFATVMIATSDFFFADGGTPNVLRTSDLTYTALGISLGFFIVETTITVKYNMGGPEMLLHHTGALVSVLTAVTTGQGHMHTMWMLATEFTTPFIDLRWWLDKANLKSSRLYMYNGMAIFVSWVVARLCIFPPFFYVVWQQREQISLVYPFARALLFIIPAVLLALNLIWFQKIIKGVMKLLSAQPSGSHSQEVQSPKSE